MKAFYIMSITSGTEEAFTFETVVGVFDNPEDAKRELLKVVPEGYAPEGMKMEVFSAKWLREWADKVDGRAA